MMTEVEEPLLRLMDAENGFIDMSLFASVELNIEHPAKEYEPKK